MKHGHPLKRLLLCLPLLMLLCLTGCHKQIRLECSAKDLSEGLKMTVLMREEFADRTNPPSFRDAAEEALYAYRSEDGWVTDEHVRPLYNNSEEYAGFAETVQQIRLAAYDSAGNVVRVSGDIDLLPPHTFYAVTALEYDWESGEVTVTDTCLRYWNGKSVFGWWETVLIAANIIAALAAGAIRITETERKGQKCSPGEILIMLIGFLPFLLEIGLFILMFTPAVSGPATAAGAGTASSAGAGTVAQKLGVLLPVLILMHPGLWLLTASAVKRVRCGKPQKTNDNGEIK